MIPLAQSSLRMHPYALFHPDLSLLAEVHDRLLLKIIFKQATKILTNVRRNSRKETLLGIPLSLWNCPYVKLSILHQYIPNLLRKQQLHTNHYLYSNGSNKTNNNTDQVLRNYIVIILFMI